jgi:hypothetical protein
MDGWRSKVEAGVENVSMLKLVVRLEKADRE